MTDHKTGGPCGPEPTLLQNLISLAVKLVRAAVDFGGGIGDIEPAAIAVRIDAEGKLDVGLMDSMHLDLSSEAGGALLTRLLARILAEPDMLAVMLITDTYQWSLEGVIPQDYGFATGDELACAFSKMGHEERTKIASRTEAVHAAIDTKGGRASVSQRYIWSCGRRVRSGEPYILVAGSNVQLEGRLFSSSGDKPN